MKDIPLELIQRAADKDIQAFEEIYKGCCGFVYSVALKILNNNQDAQDVTQDVFVKLYNSLKGFNFKSSFKTWLYRITANSAINAYNKRKRETIPRVDFEAIKDTLAAPEKQDYLKQENEKKLDSMMDILPAQQKACLTLREIQGLSYQEIARALKVNKNSVRTWLRRARKTLIDN
ncbi:MAG: RNA polymerase sigma factor [Candidatus Omnitrophota bacterium]|nr:RNA polymerase sigma factor [Candidatus Omnitrophota bacterium]